MSDQIRSKASLINCRSCESRSLEVAESKKEFPLYIWPLPEGEVTALENIDVYVCRDCGYIQLQNMDNDTISEIYRDEAFNIENRKQKYDRYSMMTERDRSKFEKTKVLEIGGGRNPFVGILPDTSEKWMADFSVDEKVQAEVEGFFVGDFVEINIPEGEFDYVFMFHVLEHFNDPASALRKIRALLNSKGRVVIEVPNFTLESEVRPDYTIFHMHISLFTQTSLLAIMMRHGFSCVKSYKEDEVLLAEFCLGSDQSPENHNDHSLRFVGDVRSNISKCSSELKRIVQDIGDGDGNLAIFGGGGASTLFLFNYPFLIDRVVCALDNDKNKEGRFLCNGKIPIVTPAHLKAFNINHVIVLQKNHIEYMGNHEMNYIDIGDIYGR